QRSRSAALEDAKRAYTASRSGWRMRRLYSRSMSGSSMRSDTQVGFAHRVVATQPLGRAVERDAPVLDDGASIGMRERDRRVLLRHEHRQSLALQVAQHREQLLDDAWRKPHRGLVEQQQ